MKPRVLIFIDWFSPGYKAGGPTTSNVNIVDHLGDIIDFYVITSNTDYNETSPYHIVEADRWVSYKNAHVYYFSRRSLSLSKLKKVAMAAECDVWYVNGIYSRNFSISPLIIAKSLHPKRLIVSARGMLSPHAYKVKGAAKKFFLIAAKTIGLYDGVIFHGTNERECEYIRKAISKNAKAIAIENMPRKLTNGMSLSLKRVGEIRLVSFARISPEKNTLYAIKALSYCKTKVCFDIYGQINSDSYWAECKQAIRVLPANITVTYKGTVAPIGMQTLYKQYDVLYLPSTGENFGHAILESLMNCRPVVISDQTPWRNLQQYNIGYDLSLIKPEEFADKIDNMSLESKEAFDARCRACYNYAHTFCNRSEVRAAYMNLFGLDN